MAYASGSGLRVAYVAETTFGTTPATPSFKTFRTTGGGLRTNKATGTSDELNPDRNVRDEFLLGMDTAGDYGFELSYGNLDDMLEAAVQGTWATNVLKNGIVPKSFTFEETLEMGTTDSFARFTGCMVNSLSLSLASRQAVTGSVSLMARDETLATAIVTGATYGAPTSEPISTASAHVASLSVAGATPKVRSLSLEINNNLRTRTLVGDKFSAEFGAGRLDVTGTLEAYFEDNTLYQKVLDHGGGALSFTVGNATTKKYTILLPKIILGSGTKQIGGNSDDVMVSIPFRAVYDTTEAASVKITRAVV
jgi:hypothetical protein